MWFTGSAFLEKNFATDQLFKTHNQLQIIQKRMQDMEKKRTGNTETPGTELDSIDRQRFKSS